MYSLINSNFNRTYNPSSKQNVLCDIKRLLSIRDTGVQSKACGYLMEVINKYNYNSTERSSIVQYLLNNDITIFLCESTSNLDLSLLRTVLQCIRLLWREKCFFAEEHASISMTAISRALVHYTTINAFNAIDICLHFICDLLNGIKYHGTISPLSYQSAYNTEQLLACFTNLADRIRTKANSILSSALALHSLLSYQPAELDLGSNLGNALVEIIDKWTQLLISALKHTALVGVDSELGMLLIVKCEIGVDALRLIQVLEKSKEPKDFVCKILKDEREVNTLQQSSVKLRHIILEAMKELVVFVKENLDAIGSEEYGVYIKFLRNFIHENLDTNILPDFCDVLFSNGYMTMLPKIQMLRNDTLIRKTSTYVLGEMLKVLAVKYLTIENNDDDSISLVADIHMGLTQLQNGFEKPQILGLHLQKDKPYALLIYIYFHCQSTENPVESTAPLLPYLIEHILSFPKAIKPPGYIIKAMWLVFAMSTLSNASLESLAEKIYLEKAVERFVAFLSPEPHIYYTHNPALLLWVFTSSRIPNVVRLHVVSQWLKNENRLPEEIIQAPAVWELLLNILIQIKDDIILRNCMEAVNICIERSDEKSCDKFANLLWSLLPEFLSKALVDCNEMDTNICYLLDLAIAKQPSSIDYSLSLKLAELITTLYTKNTPQLVKIALKHYFEYVCLKLCLLLLNTSKENDNKVLFMYLNRSGFLSSVLLSSYSSNDKVSCVALKLLTCIITNFAKNNYSPTSLLQVQTGLLVKSLSENAYTERGTSLLQFVYAILSSNANTPIVLSYELKVAPSGTQQCNALRALMFRVQLILCSGISLNKTKDGWKTLNSIFTHAILYKKDSKLIATLTTQPWTHILVQYQITQTVTQDFLMFLLNWLNLLKVTLKNAAKGKKYYISKYSLIGKTLVSLKAKLNREEHKDLITRVLSVVNEIL